MEKNYEILSYTDELKTKIKSVKRKEDGVIFTIGDLVSLNGETEYDNCPIRSMKTTPYVGGIEGVYVDADVNSERRGFGAHLTAINKTV